MPSTYTPISTTTLGSTQATFTFSSIPSTYTDLVMVIQKTTTSASQDNMTFNGTTTGYSDTSIGGNGTTASSGRASSAPRINVETAVTQSTSTQASQIKVNFMNYANTSVFKTLMIRTDNAGYGTLAKVGLWQNTAAISSITLTPSAGSYQAGSTFTLYGIAAA